MIPPTVFAIFAGLLIGSFLNVCVYRLPNRLSVVRPRSFCPACKHAIAWYDNIPVISYLILRRRCRYCSKTIGWRYPSVELVTGILFALVAFRYGWTVSALKWIVFEMVLVVLFWTDVEEQMLPDELTLGGTIASLIFAGFVKVPSLFGQFFFPTWMPLTQSFFNAALGAVLLSVPIWLVGMLYQRMRKREGLGFGDVKLLLMLGVFLGVENGLLALLIGAMAGSVLGLLYVFAARKEFADTELPFGSFLCAGAALVPLINRL